MLHGFSRVREYFLQKATYSSYSSTWLTCSQNSQLVSITVSGPLINMHPYNIRLLLDNSNPMLSTPSPLGYMRSRGRCSTLELTAAGQKFTQTWHSTFCQFIENYRLTIHFKLVFNSTIEQPAAPSSLN